MEQVAASSNVQIRTRSHKKRRETTLTNENNKSPVTNTKEVEIYEVCDKDFKIIVLEELCELQDYTDKWNKEKSIWTRCEYQRKGRNHTEEQNRNYEAEEYNN